MSEIMKIKIITDIATELVTLADVKTHLRVDVSDEDTYIPSLIAAARDKVEHYTGRTIGEKTLEGILDDFPDSDYIELLESPVQSITSIKYTDSDETENTWSSDDYISNLDIIPEKIMPAYGETWPSFIPHPTGAVRIRYVAGHTSANLPDAVKHAILLVIGDLYENREASSDLKRYEVPFSVKALLHTYRVRWF